jgi:hypothetical protein
MISGAGAIIVVLTHVWLTLWAAKSPHLTVAAVVNGLVAKVSIHAFELVDAPRMSREATPRHGRE